MYSEYESVALDLRTPDWRVGDAVPGEVSLRWDAAAGSVAAYLPSGGKLEAGAFAENLTQRITFLQKALGVLLRRGRNHPADFGLVPKRMGNAIRLQDVLADAWDAPVSMEPFPELEKVLDVGWFAADADPHRFGALYVGHSSHGGVTQWFLGQVGLDTDTPREGARWDDEEGCAALFAQVNDADVAEAGLVAAALTLEDFGKRREKAEIRARTMRAREAFQRPRDRIKPRLVENAWYDSVRGTDVFEAANVSLYPMPVALDSHSVFGYSERPKPVNVATSVVPDLRYRHRGVGAPDPENLDDTMSALAVLWQQELDKRSLGVVCRYRAPAPGGGKVVMHLLATRRPEEILDHAAACDIPEGAALERLNLVGGDAEWVEVGVAGGTGTD